MKNWIMVFLLLASGAFGKTLWGNKSWNIYRINLKVGSIVKIRFEEKMVLKWKMEQKNVRFEDSKGRKATGSAFDFFPDISIAENQNVKNQNQMNVSRDNTYVIPAKIVAVDGDNAILHGLTRSTLDNETIRMEISGEFGFSSLRPDFSVLSGDIYNLEFRIVFENPTNDAILNPEDFVYKTNITEIMTNYEIVTNDTNSIMTNMVLSTNMSSIRLQFEGLTDQKKRELMIQYMNSMMGTLFRKE